MEKCTWLRGSARSIDIVEVISFVFCLACLVCLFILMDFFIAVCGYRCFSVSHFPGLDLDLLCLSSSDHNCKDDTSCIVGPSVGASVCIGINCQALKAWGLSVLQVECCYFMEITHSSTNLAWLDLTSTCQHQTKLIRDFYRASLRETASTKPQPDMIVFSNRQNGGREGPRSLDHCC